MPIIEYLHPLVVPFAFVLTRILGLFMFTPLLSSTVVPGKFKTLFAFMFALAVFPTAARNGLPASAASDIATIGMVMFGELLIGVVLGLLAGLPIAALQMGGFIMGYQMGLGLAQAYNPEMDGSDDVISQLLFFMGITAYIAAGGLDTVFVALLGTFDRVPVGAFAGQHVPLDLYVGILSSGLELAIRVAAPVLGVILLALLAMGFVMKTMPQINILSVGFAAKIVAGLAMLAVSVSAVDSALREDLFSTLDQILGWVDSLSSH
ncbi:MAG: flagellar biosynthetic protein FliR [Phycisphaerales bacterium]|nr:flagellar biosynthetic protein FliR [Phycisphaerales bacterium]